MGDSAIATTSQPDPDQPEQPAPWYPWPELHEPLSQLHAECSTLNQETIHVIREVAATLDALMADTDRALDRLRTVYAARERLTDAQADRILHDLHQAATEQDGA